MYEIDKQRVAIAIQNAASRGSQSCTRQWPPLSEAGSVRRGKTNRDEGGWRRYRDGGGRVSATRQRSVKALMM